MRYREYASGSAPNENEEISLSSLTENKEFWLAKKPNFNNLQL